MNKKEYLITDWIKKAENDLAMDWEPTNGDVDEAYNAANAIKKIIIMKSNFQ